jgi:site-specific DNA-methyltransferase (adenine-specific)
MPKWIRKASESARDGATVVMLIPARPDTKYWHEYIWNKRRHRSRLFVEVRLVKGRLKFGEANEGAPFPSAVVIFHSDRRPNDVFKLMVPRSKLEKMFDNS